MPETYFFGYEITEDQFGNTVIEATSTYFEYDAGNDTFTYFLTGETDDENPDINLVDVTANVNTALFYSPSQDLVIDLNTTDFDYTMLDVQWGQGQTTTVFAIIGDTSDFVFVVAGDPWYPVTGSDWDAIESSITSFSTPSGALGPGQVLSLTDVIESETVFEGTSGNDSLNGGQGFSFFFSSAGNDSYSAGGQAFDQVSFESDPGGVNVNLGNGTGTDGFGDTDSFSGIEVLRGSAFDDRFVGDSENNLFRGLQGNDNMNGGAGADQVLYNLDEAYGGLNGVTVDLQQGTATDGFGDQDTLSNIEDVLGTNFDDQITGKKGTNILEGLDGNDTLGGLGGSDFIGGGAGDDTIEGGKGADLMFGDEDDDMLYGGQGTDEMYGGDGRDYLNGASADDYMDGGRNADIMEGGKGTDTMFGGDGRDDIFGGEGQDTLFGDAGDDTLNGGGNDDVLDGGDDNDVLLGGNGADTLNGGAGDDELTGGGGGDLYIFAGDFGDDLIFGFNRNKDGEFIDLSGAAGIDDITDLRNNHLSEDGNGNAVITDDNGNTITVDGVAMTAFNDDDFLF